MSETRRPYVDQAVVALRWLFIGLGFIVAFQNQEYGLAGSGTHWPSLFGLLGIALAYNLIATMLLLIRKYPPFLTILFVLLDTLLSLGLMEASGGYASPLSFFPLLPAITAALCLHLLAGVGVALGIVVVHLILGLMRSPAPSIPLMERLGDGGLLILITLVAGLICGRMKRDIEERWHEEQERQRQRLRAHRQQSQLIFELTSTLSATLNYQRVLEAILDVGAIGLQELMARETPLVGIVLLFQRDKLSVAAARHLPPRDLQAVLEGREGAVADALSNAEPVLCMQPVQDPELGQFVALHQCKEAFIIPLRAGFEGFGVAIFGTPAIGVFTPEYQDLLVALCNQGVVALQNAQLYQSLMEEKERIVAVEEDARKKLARDLHDGPTQSIAAIAMRANYARVLMEQSPDDADIEEELRRIEELARRTTKEIRHMLFTLRPLILETQGLRAALEQYIAKRAETDPLPIHLDAPEGVDRLLDKDQQGMIFYVIEEAISNARKHAQAGNIWVRLRMGSANFTAEVIDDGVGFDVSVLEHGYDERGSLGMLNMRERAELAGGTWKIESKPGKGTRVTLTVPLRRALG